MRLIRLLSLSMVLVFSGAFFASLATAEEMRVAVLEFPSKDRDINYVAKKWNDIILDTIKDTEGFALADQGKLEDELDDRGIEPKEGHTILAVEAKQIGPAVGADLFLMGNVQTSDGKNFQINVRAIDAGSAEERSFTVQCTKKEETIEAAAQKLLADVGSLQSDACGKYLKFAMDYAKAEQWDDAFQNYEKMLNFCESDTQKAYAHTQMGNICAQQRQDSECAKTHYMSAYEITNDWRTLAQLAVIYEGEDKHAEAISMYEDVIEMIPADDTQSRADLSARVGMVYQDGLNDGDNAVAWYEKALNYDPDYDYAIDRLLKLYFNAGEYAKAEAKMNQVLAKDPNKAMTWYPKFADEYEDLAKSFCAFEKEGNCYNEANVTEADKQQARKYYEMAIDYHLKIADLINDDQKYMDVGLIYEKMGNPTKAIEWYQKFIEKNPNDTDNYCRILFAMDDAGRKQEALQEARKMAKANPDAPCPYAILGAQKSDQARNVDTGDPCDDIRKMKDLYEAAVNEYQKGLNRCTPEDWLYNYFDGSISNLQGAIEQLLPKIDECDWM